MLRNQLERELDNAGVTATVSDTGHVVVYEGELYAAGVLAVVAEVTVDSVDELSEFLFDNPELGC